jgi:uncharacterized protein
VWDLITLVALGLWTCYTVLRSGSLWLAVGYHAAFDYMQLFVIKTRNGSVEPVNHLLNTSFQGPDWVTGGVLGRPGTSPIARAVHLRQELAQPTLT